MSLIRNCDICKIDGDEGVKAVAKYRADDREWYDVCKKHLKLVKENKLYYVLFENERT